jgi:hypothetical protein
MFFDKIVFHIVKSSFLDFGLDGRMNIQPNPTPDSRNDQQPD